MEEYDLRDTSYEKWGQGYASQWELMSDLFAWVDLRLYLFYKHHQWLGPKNDMRNMLGLVVSREEFEHNLMKGAQLGLTAQLDGQEAEELTATAAVIRSRLGHTREEFPLSQLFQRCGLDEFEQSCLVLAYAAVLDHKYEKLLAYLQDDITLKAPTVALAVQLFLPQGRTMEEYLSRFSRRDRFTQLFDGERLLAGQLILHPGVQEFLSTGTVAPLPGMRLFDGAREKPDGALVIRQELARRLDLLYQEPGERAICLTGGAGAGKRFQVEHLMTRNRRRCVFVELDGERPEERAREGVLVARLTDGYVYGVAASFFSVILVNYAFTYPYGAVDFTIAGYPLTFLTMLSVSLIVSAMTSQIKRQEKQRIEAEREALRANLLRAVSHDLRTPLTSIVGSTSAILENADVLSRQQKAELLRGVRDEAQWLIRMVENLLSITRMGDPAARIDKELQAVEEVLASVAAKFQQRFPAIHLELAAPEEPLFVPMDAILIEQVLMNLLENAACHGHCAHIRLFVELEGQMAVFTVQDDGQGISPDVLPTIFTPHLRSQTHSTDARRNMGIGLSVCLSIVKAHGGVMSAANAPEGGAVFRFTLPVEELSMEDTSLEDQGKDPHHRG